MDAFEGKTAVITGAASGIGLALAQRFAGDGMQLVLADIEEGPLAEAEEKLSAGGADVLAVPTDVSKWDDVESLAAATHAHFGSVHLLCNNAGVGGGGGLMWDLTLDDWKWTIDVNLWSVIHGQKAFVPSMLAHGEHAHVVNTASLAGIFTNPFMGPYTGTKFGVVALSEVLHYDLSIAAADIHVSVLCPAFVATNIAESDRNRPAELSDSASIQNEPGQADMMKEVIARGDSPSNIADAVAEAVSSDTFWILPHPQGDAVAGDRVKRMLDRENPEMRLPDFG
jgi:NAD(P)-dependent dehydrogenase (short-subunit alcohol dehydrogenase family)